MTLKDLKPSILEMPEKDALQLIVQVRDRRLTLQPPKPKKARVAKGKPIAIAVLAEALAEADDDEDDHLD